MTHVATVHKVHEDQLFCCDLCEFRTKYRPHLNRHMTAAHSTFAGVKDRFQEVLGGLKCNICSKIIADKLRFNYHYFSHHIGKRHCDACGKTFITVTTYLRHVKMVHKKIKKFHCDFPGCGKAYFTRSALKDHKNTHTGRNLIRYLAYVGYIVY